MDRRAAVQAAESLAASALAFAASLRGTISDDAAAAPGAPAGLGDGDTDPLRQLADDFLDGLAQTRRIDAQVAAVRVHLAAGYAGAAEAMLEPAASPEDHTGQEMAVIAEVACALTVSEPAAANLLAEAHNLRSFLPLTLSALEAGSLTWQHARIMVDETSGLGPEGSQALEAHFLDPEAPNPARGCPAGELVAGRFRAKARTWRERHHPVSIEQRHAKNALDRRVLFAPDRDGMAWFSAYLPADTGSGSWERATTAARAMQGPDESRTLTQLRADIVAGWLLGGHSVPGQLDGTGHVGTWANGTTANAAGGSETDTSAATGAKNPGPDSVSGVPSPRAQVLITVPVMALLGATEEPAMLDGYGPIPPSMARRLIADGATSFHRVLIDPRDGAPLEIGRTSYPVTKAQRRWLRLRDGKCPFPGCNNQSLDNEADHILAWAQGGPTGISNLGQPCRKHHKLKHSTPWKPTPASKNEPPGWTSPAGRHYQSEHPDWEPPHWPDRPLTWNADVPDAVELPD